MSRHVNASPDGDGNKPLLKRLVPKIHFRPGRRFRYRRSKWRFSAFCYGWNGHSQYFSYLRFAAASAEAGSSVGWLNESAHGHGYGLEAVEAVVDWAHKNLGKFIWPAATENLSRRRLAEKLRGELSGGKQIRNMNPLSIEFHGILNK
ncbi:MAG TPA: GNAT family N-acetyltransferase [Micavibrio sp.]|nr:GNAT family N-acetyltransferase [Micavibrio sp.]